MYTMRTNLDINYVYCVTYYINSMTKIKITKTFEKYQ